MNARIETLTPEMQALVRNFLALVKMPYVVTSTLRTVDEQVALYAQGRAPTPIVNLLRQKAKLPLIGEGENAYTVTNCDGINTLSNHQGGKAVDVVPANEKGNPIWPHPSDPRWEQLGKLGEAAGLRWGGRWTKPDMPHYEMKE